MYRAIQIPVVVTLSYIIDDNQTKKLLLNSKFWQREGQVQAVHRILALRDAIQTKGFDHHFLISSGHAIYRSDCVSGVDEELMAEARSLCPPVNYGAPLLCDGRFTINNTCRLLCPSSVLRPGHGNFEYQSTWVNVSAIREHVARAIDRLQLAPCAVAPAA